MLKFSAANSKTKALYRLGLVGAGRKVYSLDLPSGWTCPGARECLSKCVGGKIQDGPHCKFRCFSASQEVTFPAVHKARQYNLALLKSARYAEAMCKLIMASLPKNAGVIRYHVGGDFFNKSYLLAAVKVAELRPDVLFYAYTKSLPNAIPLMLNPSIGMLRPNFRITASRGGKYDSMIDEHGIREARVVFSENEAENLGLEIDHDDSHAANFGGSFALLIHGVQPAGSEASKALSIIRKSS